MAKARTPVDYQKFLRILTADIARDAENFARPKIHDISKTLAHFLSIELRDEKPGLVIAALTVPHFWAWSVHKGRGPVRPDKKRVLVWFRNPRDDPRYPGGVYPQRLSQRRELTKDQWDFWQLQNRLAQKNGQPEPMIVATYSKEVTPGKPFFSNRGPDGGMQGFPARATDMANAAARDFILKTIGKDRWIKGTLNF